MSRRGHSYRRHPLLKGFLLFFMIAVLLGACVGQGSTASSSASSVSADPQTSAAKQQEDSAQTSETAATQTAIQTESETQTAQTSQPEISKASAPGTAKRVKKGEDAGFSLTMLDVGQGLSLLIESDGHYAMYDGGNREHSQYVVSYLEQNGIKTLDYLFVSHYDEDHIAGLIGVLSTAKAGTVVSPDYTADSKIYESFCSHLAENGAKEVHPSPGDTYSLGNAQIEVIGPYRYDEEEENNNSVAVRITYGNFAAVATGDAEEEEEADIVNGAGDLKANVLVVGHHGSEYSSTAAFLNAVKPDAAFISVGIDNSYGHPSDEVLERLKQAGAKVYRTDKKGEVTASTDGSQYWISSNTDTYEKSLDKKPQDDSSSAAANSGTSSSAAGDDSEADYIGNANTMKFHLPDCSAVDRMSEKNKVYFSGLTRDEIIAKGYEPCQICNP